MLSYRFGSVPISSSGIDLVRVRPVLAVGAVALRAVVVEHRLALRGLRRVDRERVLRRLEAEQVLPDVAERRLGLVELVRRRQRVHHELHQRLRTDRASVAPVWYIVRFFFSSHHAGTSSQASSCRPRSSDVRRQRQVRVAEAEQVDAERRRPRSCRGRWQKVNGSLPAARRPRASSSNRAWMSSELLPQADVALAEDRAAVAEHAVDADARADEQVRPCAGPSAGRRSGTGPGAGRSGRGTRRRSRPASPSTPHCLQAFS